MSGMDELRKSEGAYKIELMQQLATIAATADGLTIEGNNFKITALTGCPDMLLFACETIIETEEKYQSSCLQWRSAFDAMHTRAMKADNRMKELQSYNLGLANESWEQAHKIDRLVKEAGLLYDMANITFSSQFIDSELKRVGIK